MTEADKAKRYILIKEICEKRNDHRERDDELQQFQFDNLEADEPSYSIDDFDNNY
jgi:hypothetical protein